MAKYIILSALVFAFLFMVARSLLMDYELLEPLKRRLKDFFWKCWSVRLRIIYVIFALVISGYLFRIFIELSVQFFYIANLEPEEVRNLAIAFIGTTSGLGALFGIYLAILRSETTERQTQTAEQGLITDRLNKATEGLGKKDGDDPVIEVRLGALYALERIAQDSIRDHVQIMEILCAYIRTSSPLLISNNPVSTAGYTVISNIGTKEPVAKKLREDIQAALTIIGRRANWPNPRERNKEENEKEYCPDLKYCDLENAVLNHGLLGTATLVHTNLEGAWFYNTDLSHAFLNLSNLTNAKFNNTQMRNTGMGGAYAWKGDFSKCINLTQKQINVMYCGIDVEIPDGLERPEHWPTEKLSEDVFEKACQKWINDS